MTRKDKKSDRVEISDDQLVASMAEAEQANLKVVGWFHSHPHITVLPSHVDIKTQFDLQQLNDKFVGLIYSCFHKEQQSEILQLIAFQSANVDGNLVQVDIPLLVYNEVGVKNEILFKKLGSIGDIFYQEDLETTAEDEIGQTDLALKILCTKNAFVDPLVEHFKCSLSKSI
jgi:BRCA1/BRCA2-containing complex subunit 3